MSLLTWLWHSIFSHRLNSEVQQELETHLSLLEEATIVQGVSKKDARAEVRRRFGSRSVYFEATRDVSLSTWLDQFGQDTRFAFRQIRKKSRLHGDCSACHRARYRRGYYDF